MPTYLPLKRHRGSAFIAVMAALFAAGIALASASTMWSLVSSGAQTSYRNTTTQLLTQAAYTLVTEANTSGNYPVATAPTAWSGSNPSIAPTQGTANAVGLITATSAAPKTDAWGSNLGYCTYPAAAQGDAVFAIISAGPDKVFQTTCTQALAGTAAGDDGVRVKSAANIRQGVGGTVYYGDPVTNVAALNALTVARVGEMRVALDTGYPYVNKTGTPGAGNWTLSGGGGGGGGSSTQAALTNVLINGGMRLDQRNNGSPVTLVPGVATYGLDRWAFSDFWVSSVGANTVQRVAGDATSQYAQRLLHASGSWTGGIGIIQALESANSIPLAGQTVTLSFRARIGLTFTGNGPIVYLICGTGTDQTPLSAVNGGWAGVSYLYPTFSTTPTTTFQKFSWTGVIPTNATQIAVIITTGRFAATAGDASNYMDVTDVQLERNATASSFAAMPVGTELALAQRYFVQFPYPNMSWADISGFARAANSAYFVTPLPVPMRVVPTMAFTGNPPALNDGFNNYPLSGPGVASTNANLSSVTWAAGMAGATASRPGILFGISGPGAVTFNAEL